MAQKFDYPKSEQELRNLLDRLYETARQAIEVGQSVSFKGLLEIIRSKTVVLTAIHNIKGNKGSNTPGTDGQTMRRDILQKDIKDILARVDEMFDHYQPQPVRRKEIPKPGKPGEMRPLGIPTISDRVIQECMRIVLEPILEAQFFRHSYGFRPMRDAQMALERLTRVVHSTGFKWVIEGDISKFFDTVNHTKMLNILWHMGIRDRRVLMIVKAMLKAGIMNEIQENPLGAPQGGIISPLLANAYLTSMDKWITREWEDKKTQHKYADEGKRLRALRDSSSLQPAYLIRYADDWVLVTNSRRNAEKWKVKIAKYLNGQLKLTLSESKTLITNVTRRSVKFLGYELKAERANTRKGLRTRTRPDRNRLKSKVAEIRQSIRRIRHIPSRDKESIVHHINLVNSQIRGLIQYYQTTTSVNKVLSRYSMSVDLTFRRALHGARISYAWIPANQLNNLIGAHSQYSWKRPAVKYKDFQIGLTSMGMCKWTPTSIKSQDETPYTETGREKYSMRTGKARPLARIDELVLDLRLSNLIGAHSNRTLYNFEYFLNRAYAYNRDRGKCVVCRQVVTPTEANFHHRNPHLPIELVNRVSNIVTTHSRCHGLVHDGQDCEAILASQEWKRVLTLRETLGN